VWCCVVTVIFLFLAIYRLHFGYLIVLNKNKKNIRTIDNGVEMALEKRRDENFSFQGMFQTGDFRCAFCN